MGATEAGQITDIWTHELLKKQWNTIINNIQFLTPPCRGVFSGDRAPMHHMKNFAIFTLGMAATTPTPTLWQFRPVLNFQVPGGLVVVDVDNQCRTICERKLQELAPEVIRFWDVPVVSLANTKTERRVTYFATWPNPDIQPLQRQHNIRKIKDALQGCKAVVGTTLLMQLSSTKIADFEKTEAFLQIANNCDACSPH